MQFYRILCQCQYLATSQRDRGGITIDGSFSLGSLRGQHRNKVNGCFSAMLGDQLRIEGRLAIARNLQVDPPRVGRHGLAPVAVAAPIAAAPSAR